MLVLKTLQQMHGNHGLYVNKVIERLPNLKDAPLPHELEAIHRVAWFPGGAAAGAALLASGGAAGLVRVQWVHKQ